MKESIVWFQKPKKGEFDEPKEGEFHGSFGGRDIPRRSWSLELGVGVRKREGDERGFTQSVTRKVQDNTRQPQETR